MRTAEEWIAQADAIPTTRETLKNEWRINYTKQIQLAAMKEGMRRAAILAAEWKRGYVMDTSEDEAQFLACVGIHNKILMAAEQLTEKDLQ